MADAKTRSFGWVIRERRRQLDLTQEEVAQRIKTTGPYITHLETGKRHPSRKVVVKPSDALELDARDLFLLANPEVGSLISEQQKSDGASAWDAFVRDKKARKIHNITTNRWRSSRGWRRWAIYKTTGLYLRPKRRSSSFRSIVVCPQSLLLSPRPPWTAWPSATSGT